MGALVLVEECPAELEIAADDSVVALSALAAYGLRRAGIAYEFFNDADEAPLREAAARLWEEELAWLDRLDDALAQALPELAASGLRPALLYGRYLKGVLDIVYIRAWQLSRLLDRAPERVVLYARASDEEALAHQLWFQSGPTVLARVLPILADRREVGHETRSVPPYLSGETPPVLTAGGARGSRLRTAARRAYESLLGIGRRVAWRGPRLTLLLLGRGYDLGLLLDASRAGGHRCLLRTRNGAVDVTGLRGRPVAVDVGRVWGRALPAEAVGPGPDFRTAAAALTDPAHELWRWPDGWFDAPLSQVLRPRLAYWIAEVLPALQAEFDRARLLLERERVDFVVAPHMASVSDHAWVAAARLAPASEAVQIEHGDSPLGNPVWDLFNLFPFDQHFAPSADLAAHYRRRAALYERHTAAVHVGSYRWHESSSRSLRPARHGERELLVYVLDTVLGDTRYLNNEARDDVWQYELQTRLIGALADDGRYDVVVKPLAGQGPAAALVRNPIDRFVEELARPNVRVSFTPFPRWLERADRVVLDAASTPVYETALAGVPFITLLSLDVACRPEAAEQLRAHLVPFATLDEAVERLRAFLDDPDPRRPELHWDTPDVLSVLEALGPVSAPRG